MVSVCVGQLQLPKWLSSEAHSLIKSLLERNVSKRLGGGKSSMFVVRGIPALKAHAFFKVRFGFALSCFLLKGPSGLPAFSSL